MNQKNILPTDCVLGITYACNSRCIMCDIWRIKNPPQLNPEEYRKLPSSLRDINISGGEPFMHTNIVQVVKVVAETCPRARLVISSNGFASALIEERMKEILKINKNIGLAFSIDGIGETHNEIRGIPDGFNKVMDTVERMKKLGVNNIRLAFTVLPENVAHFSRVYNEARKRGAQFTYAFAQSSENYFGGKQITNTPNAERLTKEFSYVIAQELKSWNPKRWARAYFAYGLYQFAAKKRQVLSNDPGTKFFFLDPDGLVFPSVAHNHIMGNIQDVKNWEELWFSAEADQAREKVRAEGKPVWMICTARTAIKKHPVRVGWWVVRGKLGGVEL